MRVIDIIKPLYEFAPPQDPNLAVELLTTLANMIVNNQLEPKLKKEAVNIIGSIEKLSLIHI